MQGAYAGEAGSGCDQQHLHPERRRKRVGDGTDGADRPKHRDEPGEGAPLGDAEGMYCEDRNEGQRDEKRDDEERYEGRGAEDARQTTFQMAGKPTK